MMFIPPEGAIQWEVESFKNGQPLIEPIAVWTLWEESRDYIDEGGCKTGFPIIIDSIPEPWKSMTQEHLKKGYIRRPSMCTCWGRIIE